MLESFGLHYSRGLPAEIGPPEAQFKSNPGIQAGLTHSEESKERKAPLILGAKPSSAHVLVVAFSPIRAEKIEDSPKRQEGPSRTACSHSPPIRRQLGLQFLCMESRCWCGPPVEGLEQGCSFLCSLI